MVDLRHRIENAWEHRNELAPDHLVLLRPTVEQVIAALESGTLRVAEPAASGWRVQEWVKKAVLLYFRVNDMRLMDGQPAPYWDKVPARFEGASEDEFRAVGARVVPGAIVRRGAYLGHDVVLMPSFINIGAYVGAGSMVDTWATIGSCAQVGSNCHISGGAGIGGVLEPLQAAPTIIEDNCFIGARSEVVEGVIVETGAVLSMGVFISANTKIVDRESGQIHVGRVPAYSVVVPGNLNRGPNQPSTYCAVIMKTVDERTRSKTSINELLRD
jgi:2,3,4,5-tetrahydropyridine-2-carboxylate N-succinyltransferase